MGNDIYMGSFMTIIEAAQSLVLSLNSPAVGHSVYVHQEVNEDKSLTPTIHVAVRPTYLNKIKVPTEHQGYPVKQVPWPKGA